jgi:hypothetical protein
MAVSYWKKSGREKSIMLTSLILFSLFSSAYVRKCFSFFTLNVCVCVCVWVYVCLCKFVFLFPVSLWLWVVDSLVLELKGVLHDWGFKEWESQKVTDCTTRVSFFQDFSDCLFQQLFLWKIIEANLKCFFTQKNTLSFYELLLGLFLNFLESFHCSI